MDPPPAVAEVLGCLEEQKAILEGIAHASGPASPLTVPSAAEDVAFTHPPRTPLAPGPWGEPAGTLAVQIEGRIDAALGPRAAASAWRTAHGHDRPQESRNADPAAPAQRWSGLGPGGGTTSTPTTSTPRAHPGTNSGGAGGGSGGGPRCRLESFARLGITHCGCLDGLPCIAAEPLRPWTGAAGPRAEAAGTAGGSTQRPFRGGSGATAASVRSGHEKSTWERAGSLDESHFEASFGSLRAGLGEMRAILRRMSQIFPPD